MSLQVEKLEKNMAKLTIEVSAEELEKAIESAYQKNKKNVTCYETPFGSLMLGINAKDIKITEEENDISVDVRYALELNYEHLADCTIKMAIQSKNGGDFHICS